MHSRWLILGALAAFSTAAWAFPWDIDMVDSTFLRAFEWKMLPLPEGTVSTNRYVAQHERNTPEGQALTSPYPSTDATVATGQKMFFSYCAPCHGQDGKGGAEVMRNDPANGIKRFPVPAPVLSGPGAISALRSDGYIYLTIRNGGAIMPAYYYAMEDEEMWAVVAYIRTLDGARFTPPPAAPPTGPE